MFTNDIERFRLLPDNTYTVGGSTVVADGFILHSPNVAAFYAGGAPGPFTLDHKAAATNSSFQDAYRNWAATGTTVTGGGSMGYLGLKANDIDHTDLVVQLAKREGIVAPDRIRFLFTSELNGSAPTGADSQEGLEGLRLFPVDNDNVNVGIGDWYAANINSSGAITEPEERLDIVDGRVRIRELPEPAGEATGTYMMMVVDDATAPSGERGVVKWVDPNDLPGGSDCDWTISTANNWLTTAWQTLGSNGVCPEIDWKVGIGTNAPTSKLHVYNTVNSGVNNFTGLFAIDGSAVQKTGSRMVSSGTGDRHYGGHGLAQGGTELNTGLRGVGEILSGVTGMKNDGGYFWGLIRSGGITDNNHGVRAYAEVNGTATCNYGVHAVATGSGATTHYGVYAQVPYASPHWAVYSTGHTFSTGGATWIPSDEDLKSGIEDYQGGLEGVMQLAPKTYTHNTDQFPQMNLPQGQQIGLLAQELEQVFPNLVREAHHPAQMDSVGNEVSAAVDFKAMQPGGLIPVIISAIQEQQALITALQTQLAEMQQALAACCTAGSDDDQRSGTIDDELPLDPATERLLTIAPNPFTDQTTVSYVLERSGRAQLMVNSSDGKHLQVLEEAARTEGQYNYAWSTAHLAPGVYYVTLLLDGEPLVKRAVKVR